jgi:hypothetical protein
MAVQWISASTPRKMRNCKEDILILTIVKFIRFGFFSFLFQVSHSDFRWLWWWWRWRWWLIPIHYFDVKVKRAHRSLPVITDVMLYIVQWFSSYTRYDVFVWDDTKSGCASIVRWLVAVLLMCLFCCCNIGTYGSEASVGMLWSKPSLYFRQWSLFRKAVGKV